MKKLIAFALCACIAATAAFAQTRQKAKDEIARLEKMPAQIEEMLKQAWEAGRTQTDTVITTPYGKVTIKFNLDELLKQRYTGDTLTTQLLWSHGQIAGNELRINNDGSWVNKTYEGMKATITHELGHYMDKKSYPVLEGSRYRTAIDFSEIEADAFAMRYLGKARFIEIYQSDSSSYINAVIKRMEEMEREDKETLADFAPLPMRLRKRLRDRNRHGRKKRGRWRRMRVKRSKRGKWQSGKQRGRKREKRRRGRRL